MQENTTPAEFHGNPESGIDQFLNRSAEPTVDELVGMVGNAETQAEILTNTLKGQVEVTQACDNRIAELEAKVAELGKSVEYKHEEMLRYKEAWDTLRNNVSNAESAFKEILSGDVDATSIMETYGAVLVEHLSWDLENEVEVVITVTWRGTVSLPFGTDASDLDIDDFGLNEPEHNEYSSHFDGIHDYSIDER